LETPKNEVYPAIESDDIHLVVWLSIAAAGGQSAAPKPEDSAPSATGVIEASTQPDNSTLDTADLLIKDWENRQTAAKEQRD
jgi:hypothetical protein